MTEIRHCCWCALLPRLQSYTDFTRNKLPCSLRVARNRVRGLQLWRCRIQSCNLDPPVWCAQRKICRHLIPSFSHRVGWIPQCLEFSCGSLTAFETSFGCPLTWPRFISTQSLMIVYTIYYFSAAQWIPCHKDLRFRYEVGVNWCLSTQLAIISNCLLSLLSMPTTHCHLN